jgi:hypothetical protein
MGDAQALAPADALQLAQHLLNTGRPFHAHEVLEASWRAAPPDERDLWQGLAQLAVGLTHAMRGNERGAAALLRRGATRIRGYRPDGAAPESGGPHGIDVLALAGAADQLADRIEQRGLAAVEPATLTLRLRATA